jgi:Abnormal spindle-like microcephaly-assoc'd, ASPM-SPD-2-Hydin
LNRTRSLTVFICLLLSISTSFATQNQSPSSARVIENNLPILFEPAAGWGDGSVAMVGRAANMTVGFQPAAVVVGFQGKKASQFKIEFSGAQPTAPSGAELQKSQTNYLLGNDPTHWRTHVPNYARVTYTGLYPGIDAVFYGNGHQMEHDFIVYPGADYGKIRMHLTDNARASLGRDGALVITLEDGSLLMQKPVIYQEEAGKSQERRGSFRLLPNGDIGFIVAGYDPRQTLVIDPVLSFSTYLSPMASVANRIATDTAGDNYLTGIGTLGFPVTRTAFAGCATCTTGNVVTFISKLSADGTTLLYSTVLGGNNFAQPTGLAVDANGNAVVSGWTGATNFPTKFGQPIATPSNNYLGFLVSLSADGSSLNYGTLLSSSPSSGLNTDTYAMTVALDPSGNAYVTGETGNGFFTTAGALNQGVGSGYGNQFNVFLAKFSPAGGLLYSAILGIADPQNGGGGPIGAYAITVDAAGDAYVAGQAGTLWPISSNAYLNHIAGSMPYATPFVMKVAPDAKSFLYSTYLDYAYVVTGIAVLQNGNVFVTGDGVGASYPTTANAYQQSSSSSGGAFLTELDASGSSLVYSTVIGDSSYNVNGLALDTNGDIWLAAQSSNSQFPLVTPLQSTFPLGQGVTEPISVLNQFDPTGQTLEFSTFLGGTADGYASSVAIDSNHRAHVAGAAGYGMYTTPGVYAGQVPVPGPGYSGATYAYVALVDKTVAAPAVCVSPNTGLYVGSLPAGTFVDRPVTITNCGSQPLTITGASAAASVFTIPASENGCTQTLPVGQSCTFNVRYSPTALETDSSTLTIQSNASIPQTVLPLSGSGVVPVIAVSTTSFDYTIVGQTSAPQIVIVQDRGGAPLVLDPTKTTVSGDFSLKGLGACGSPIFTSCGLAVYFTPTAPGIRTGTLSIGSNDPSHPTVSVQLQGVGYTNAPVPEVTSLSSQLVQAGVAETNFIVQGYGFLPSSTVEVNGVPQQTTYLSRTSLSVTLAASSLPASSYGEPAVTVVTPAPGGGTSVPYTLTEFQLIPASSASMIYEPVSKQLFTSTPAAGATNANTILPINPWDATVGTPISVGNDPGVLAASTDGKYLYVALNGDHAIQRINLSTNAIERTFPLPVDPQFGNLTVSDMHVVPGNGTEVVASLRANASPSEDGIAFFNDGGLVNEIPGLLQPGQGPFVSVDRFTFTNDPSTLYAIAALTSYGFAELSYSSAGLGYVGNSCCVPGSSSQSSGGNLATDGTLLYTATGLVWNPSDSGQIVHTYAVPTAPFLDSVIPDASTGKTYFLNQYGQYFQYSATTILAFDQTSLAQTGALSFTGDTNISSASGTQLVRWGKNGFAFRAGPIPLSTSTSILLFTSSITSASNLNPLPVATTLTPASTPAAGTDFVLTVNGSNFIPGSTVEWNGSPRLTTVVSSTQLIATIYASDIATTGTAQVVVVSPGQGGTSAALSFTISAPLAPAPISVLSPASLTFASQLVGTSSSAQTVTLTNSGNADLTGISIALTGAAANSFTETSTCGVTVNAGKSCVISVVFTPTAAGNAAATITVTDNAGTSPQSIDLSGTAVAPPSVPGVTLSPASLTFASQLVGTSSSAQMVTLTNSGNADLTGISIALTGAAANSFTETSTCGVTVSAGKSCVISVVFTPTAAGNGSATITVTDNAGTSPQAIGLSGTAPQPAFVIAAQTGGSTSSTVTPGQPAIYALSITSVNGFSGALALNCNNLPTNASCTFAPASLTLSGGTAATFTVTIATQTTQTAALVRNVSLGLSLVGFLFQVPTGKKRGRGARTATILFLFAIAIGVSACGGNASSSGTAVTSQAAVAPGTYTIQVVASNGTTKQMVPLTLVVQ